MAASARSSKASIIPQGCDERSGDVDTGHRTFEAVARRKEHCSLVYGAIRQFDPQRAPWRDTRLDRTAASPTSPQIVAPPESQPNAHAWQYPPRVGEATLHRAFAAVPILRHLAGGAFVEILLGLELLLPGPSLVFTGPEATGP